jgi:plasmid stabilization system protein ParE
MGKWLDQVDVEKGSAPRTASAALAVSHSTTSDIYDIRHTLTPCEAAEAEYDRLGQQIDALADQAQAARARGDALEGERLGAEVRAMVVGPYLQARERYARLLARSA